MDTNAVEYLKSLIDAEALLKHYNARHIRNNGYEIRCCCPIHGGNNQTAFVFNLKNKLWFCHTQCKIGGDIYDLVMHMEQLDFTSAVQRIAEIFGIDISSMAIVLRSNMVLQDTKQWIDMMRRIVDSNDSERVPDEFDINMLGELLPINSYRQFNKEVLQQFGIRYCTANQRIVVPIYQNNLLVGVTMRRTTKHPAKWLHQPAGLHTGEYLYNFDNIKKNETLILVEGCWDCINYIMHGFPNTVATFGCHLTPEQERLIMLTTYDIILSYDMDIAGIGGTNNVIERLKYKSNIHIARIPDTKDAGELTRDEIGAAIQNKMNIYEWNKLIKEKKL